MEFGFYRATFEGQKTQSFTAFSTSTFCGGIN